MKLRCPRCRKVLSIADKYAGRAVRCPACNRAFSVPNPRATSLADRSELDLEQMARLEESSAEADDLETAPAPALDPFAPVVKTTDPGVRVCPKCGKETRSGDPYAEVLCSHCWNPIPAQITGRVAPRKAPITATASATNKGGFYAELASSVAYPIPAVASLLTAAGVAVGAGLIPVAVMTSGAYLMEQGRVGLQATADKTEPSSTQWVLMGAFALEVFFFSAVALHMFLDVVRTTAIGSDAPPNLAWSPAQWGKSFAAYLILAVYYAVMLTLVLLLTVGGEVLGRIMELDLASLLARGGSALIVGLIVISFAVPMNLLGMALGSVLQGINPVNVVRSIGRTHVHYVFLVILLSVYVILFSGAFWAILHDWFLPQVAAMRAGSQEGNLVKVALPLLAWGGVMAFYFYGTYVLARLHGLFARTFRRHLLFGTQ